jgi:hypothetical protein
MDKFVLNKQRPVGAGIVVKIDGEAAEMICELQAESGADKKFIISEMIKFCYERTEIQDRRIRIANEQIDDDRWQ